MQTKVKPIIPTSNPSNRWLDQKRATHPPVKNIPPKYLRSGWLHMRLSVAIIVIIAMLS